MKSKTLISWLPIFCLLVSIPFIVIINRVIVSATIDRTTDNITPQIAAQLIQQQSNKRSLVILDVRTPQEYANGHLDRAVNVDFYRPEFRQAIDRLERQKTYLIYCHSGVRSSRSIHLMRAMGFKQVYNLEGGIRRWQQAGFVTTLSSLDNSH
ncbi:rhodanese-like domain-containing protein [Chamaesiphon sp.]|uniref:rhodanese-like domain-containing protein n=1 Tax=Chamaesiphon sp. TaxID=2814140 RepID=UPI00359368BC